MRKLTFDELWSIKCDVWNAYSHLFCCRPLINHPNFDRFNHNNYTFERLKSTFETIRDSKPEDFDIHSEKGLESYSIYVNLLCFVYFIYYALSLRIKRNGFVEERAVCTQKIRECLTTISQKHPNGCFSASYSARRIYDVFKIHNWNNDNIPLHFKADKWIDDRLQDFQNFVNGSTYNNAYTSFHLWLLCQFCTCDWENVWLQGYDGPKERLTFFSLAQYCAYASFPAKLYQNINNFIIKDFLDAPIDNREYVAYSLATKNIIMNEEKPWTTIETTTSAIKILYLDLVFRHPKDYKKEEYINHHISKKKNRRLFSQHEEFPQIIDTVAETIKYSSGLCYSDNNLLDSPIRRNNSKLILEDAFKTLFNLPKAFLDEYPALYRLLYLTIPYIEYAKFKKIFQHEIHAPIPFNEMNEKYRVYRQGELEKLSVIDFIDNEENIKKISELLSIAFVDYKKKTDITRAINLDEFKQFSVFSITETAICLLYNIILYVRKDGTKAIIQQTNFCGEQRDRLFDYHKIKSSSKDTSKSPKKGEYLYYKPTDRQQLDAQHEKMSIIDSGIKINLKQIWPYFKKNISFSRDINIKLFLETDVCCNCRTNEIYAKKREALTQNKYIYQERNMYTHYTYFNSTEELLNIENYKDLVEFLYKIRKTLLDSCILDELAEQLKNKKISHISCYGLFLVNIRPNEDYEQILHYLQTIDKILKKNKNLFITTINEIIDSDDNEKICKALCSLNISYKYKAFFEKIKENNYSNELKDLCKQTRELLDSDSSELEQILSRENFNDGELPSVLTRIKDKLIHKYNEAVKEIERKEDDCNQDIETLYTQMYSIESHIEKIENYKSFFDKKANLIQFKESLKKEICNVVNKEIKESYAKRYEECHSREKWEEIAQLLNLYRIREWQSIIPSEIINKELLQNKHDFKNYYQIQEAYAIIKKMESIANKNFGIEELRKHIQNNEHDKYDAKIDQIINFVEQSKKFYFKDDSIRGISFPESLSFEEIEQRRKKYLDKSLHYVKVLINSKKWKRLQKVLRSIEYHEISECSLDFSCDKDFLKHCSELPSLYSAKVNEAISECITKVKEAADQQLKILEIKERSKKHWTVFDGIKNYDNPILQKTQELFLRTLQVIGQSDNALKQCEAHSHTNKNKVFMNENGEIKLNHNDVKNMMSKCEYDEDLQKELREYINTIFCIFHIRDNNNQEANFFEYYGDKIMDYLIDVTVGLAKLKSQKIKN